jgi:hypothetical protein
VGGGEKRKCQIISSLKVINTSVSCKKFPEGKKVKN